MDALRRFLEDAVAILSALLRPAGRSLRENSGLAVLSVGLAIGLWILVTDAENPTRTRVLPVDITVQSVNVPADLVVSEELSTVRLRIRVEENVLDSLTPSDFEATVDLDGLAVGEYELPVDVRPLTSRGGLRIQDVLPLEIKVRLEALFTKSVPVVVDAAGDSPSGYTMGSPDVDSDTALVTGPQARVERVAQAVASLDVSGLTESIDRSVRLEPRDDRGFLVEGVSLDPPIVDLSIEIEQTTFSRALAVKPLIVGEPDRGYNLTGVIVSPPTVTVFGSSAFIDGAASIETKPVDIDGARRDVIKTVSLDLPTDVSVSGSVSVTVTVRIAPTLGQLGFAVPVSLQGLGDGLNLAGPLPSVQITLFGPLPDLLGLSLADIVAVVDVDGKDTGTHQVRVDVTVPEGIDVRSVSPQEIEVTIENR